MKTHCMTVELFLARTWHWFALGTCALLLFSCAYSQLQPDGTLTTVGEDLIPGVTVGEDVVGAVVDAVKTAPVGDVVEAAKSGNWPGIILIVLSMFGVGVGGYIARKKIRTASAALAARRAATK